MALGDGIGRNKGVLHWSYRRQADYCLGVEAFIEWLCSKYEVFEPEDDGYTLYGDMKYHSKEELLDEFKTAIGIK